MIESALYVPTEQVPSLSSIKRALLYYDKVYLLSPDDRDIMQSSVYTQVSTGLPIGINRGPVRPLGKSANFDRDFDLTLQELKPAIVQGSVILLDAPNQDVGLFLGNMPPNENEPNPQFVFGNYRHLISNAEFITTIGKGIENTILLNENAIDIIAPTGAEDGNIEVRINGGDVTGIETRLAYNGFCNSEEERQILTRMCHARLGMLTKCIGICEIKKLAIYTTDSAIAGTMQLLERNFSRIVSESGVSEHQLSTFNNLSKLNNLILAEYIDADKLSDISVKQVLKFRTKAWGSANENRRKFLSQVKELSVESPDPDSFVESCKDEIDKYLKARTEYENEVYKLAIRLTCNFGTVGFAGSASLLQQVISAPSLELLILLGGSLITAYGAKRIPEITELLDAKSEIKDLAGYSLFRPYKGLV